MTLKFSALRVDVDSEGSDSSALIQGRGTLRRVRQSQQKLLGSILLAEEFGFSTAILHRKDARMAAIGCNPGMVASGSAEQCGARNVPNWPCSETKPLTSALSGTPGQKKYWRGG